MPPLTGDMPVPSPEDPDDDTTFKGRLYKYGSGAQDEVEDRRGQPASEAPRARKSKPKDAKPSKLALDAGLNDIENLTQKRRKALYGD